MFPAPALRKKLVAVAALTAGFSLYTACNPLKPRDRVDAPSRVSVAFDPTGLGELAQLMKTLQFRVYGVASEVRGAQEGEDVKIAIELQKKSYTLSDIQLGWKDIEVSILDAEGLALGTGSARVLVKPGLNKAGPLVIKINAVNQPITAVGIELELVSTTEGDPSALVKKAVLSWKAQSSGQGGEAELTIGKGATTYADVKAIFDDNCISCHKSATLASSQKLNLKTFPFQSGNLTDNAALMTEILKRVQEADEERVMPPGAALESENLSLLKAWEAGGFQAQATGPGLFRSELKDLKVADKITGTLTLFGVDGIELVKKDIDAYVVVENGTLRLKASMDLESPSVEMEIVVERGN